MARRPKPLTKNQVRHLRRVADNPGDIGAFNRRKGWSLTTVYALQRRGLIEAREHENGKDYLYITDAGRAALDAINLKPLADLFRL